MGNGMNCRMGEMRDKEVINIKNGDRIGFISDIELNPDDARLTAIIVYGKSKLFGIFGRDNDFIIPWRDIKLIGDDTVLVDYEEPRYMNKKPEKESFLDKIGC